MEFGAVIEIISAILAVVGIVCLGGYISEVFFLPKEMITAIKIFDERSKENADILLRVSEKGMWKRVGRETCVLILSKYAEDEELLSLINESGLECYVIDE